MKSYDSKVVNGDLLRQMIISGANNLFNHYPEVDALNVFPVPDGDTGTNMNLTMTSGAKEIMNIRNDNIYEVSKFFSKGLLFGARGNSGVILSQIFRGFSQGLEGKKEVDVNDFASAWKKASEIAYRAIMKPVEGTILTVIRESTSALNRDIDKIDTVGKAMETLLSAAKVSLGHTPELLPVLKEVGVVDSGGAGLVRIFEGMVEGVKGRIIERRQISVQHKETPEVEEVTSTKKKEGVNYLVDITIKLKPSVLKRKLDQTHYVKTFENADKQASIKVSEEEVSVRLTTKRPGIVLNLAQAYGDFTKIKVVNADFASEEEVVEEEVKKERVPYAIIATSVGEGLNKLFASLHVDYIVSGGQTMNPSTEDFLDAISEVNAEHVFILPNNSNIIMAANQACSVATGCECRVIPSRTVLQGIAACMMFDSEEDFSTNEEQMTEALGSVKSGQVTFSIKDTKIDGVTIRKNEFMGIYNSHIVTCQKTKNSAIKELIHKMVDDDSSLVTLIYGEDITAQEANALGDFIKAKYMVDVEIHNGGQPVYSYFVGVE